MRKLFPYYRIIKKIKMNNKILKTDRLNLRPITVLDLDYIHELHSMEETDEFNTLGIPEHIDETKVLLEKWIFDNNKALTTNFTFAVGLNTGNQIIGLIGINLGKVKYENAEVWFKFHKDHWNKGYATESLKLVLHFGFNELNLHRIEAGCAIGNLGSISVLEKAGMIREAHTRKLLPLKSGWSDNYGYAILASD
jgi:RimJ/RimL family protein N-acetyltransferase